MGSASEIAHTHSWFPQECCGGNDCQEITEWKEWNTEQWYISTKINSAIISKKFLIRPSQDQKKYICIANNKVYCVFSAVEF